MVLLNKTILAALEKQGDTSEKKAEDIKVVCKFFNPVGAGTWYVYEYNKEYNEVMAFVNLGDIVCAELGPVSMEELESYRGPLGLGIERDIHFPICKYTVKEIMDKVQAGEHV